MNVADVSEALSCSVQVRGQAEVNAVLNCLSSETQPHWDTSERWEGHAVKNGVRKVDESPDVAQTMVV